MMINIIILFIIFNDIKFSLLLLLLSLPVLGTSLRSLAFAFGSSVLEPDFDLK